MPIKDYVGVLSDIISRHLYYNVSKEELHSLKSIKELLTKKYLDNPGPDAPHGKLRTKISELKRIKNESFSDLILYIMQLEKDEVYFRDLRDFSIEHKLLDGDSRQITSILSNTLGALIRSGKVIRIKYGIYKLTEKGKEFLI